MPKRKAKQVRVVVPVEELALSKDENNTKGSKEDRIRALDLFASDFAIQAKSLRKQLLKQMERNFTTRVVHKFDSIVKQFPKDVLKMPYEEYIALVRGTKSVDDTQSEVVDGPVDTQETMGLIDELREKKRAMLIAEMDLELQAKIYQDPLCMITPANPLSTLHNEVSMSTKGRKIRKGEHLVLTVMSQRGSPISLDANSFQEALSLRHVLTPFITGTRAVPHI